MKTTIFFLLLIIIGALLWFGWEFKPWMPAGNAVHISSQHFANYDVEVWQRKNSSITEPFATGLFVRKQGEQWQAVLLDFEDVYHPSIVLKVENCGISVFRDDKKLGVFDGANHGFKRESDGSFFPSAILSNVPPDNWWLK